VLSNLDSKNPVLYIEFPGGGRLKLLGTLVFPTNKYMVLRLPSRAGDKSGPVLCEDVFESAVGRGGGGVSAQGSDPGPCSSAAARRPRASPAPPAPPAPHPAPHSPPHPTPPQTPLPRPQIVFSEAWWVGSKEDNPDEGRLPLPPALKTTTVHEGFDFGYGAGARADEGVAAPLRKKGAGGASQQPSSQAPLDDEPSASQVRAGSGGGAAGRVPLLGPRLRGRLNRLKPSRRSPPPPPALAPLRRAAAARDAAAVAVGGAPAPRRGGRQAALQRRQRRRVGGRRRRRERQRQRRRRRRGAARRQRRRAR
jgi:hypothetical protein